MKSFLIILSILFLIGCGPTFNGVCRHEVVYVTSVVGEHIPTRIAWGVIPDGGTHVQAQGYFLYDGWVFLHLDTRGFVYQCDQDNFKILEYYTPDEYYDMTFSFKDWGE